MYKLHFDFLPAGNDLPIAFILLKSVIPIRFDLRDNS